MNRKIKKEQIDVWRLENIEGLELRKGVSVKEPYPKHWHEEYQFCFVHDGGGELFYRGVSHNTPEISLFVVHPGEVHSNQTETGCSFRSIYVQPEIIKNTLLDSDQKAHTLPFFSNPMIFDEEIISDYLKLHILTENSGATLEIETIMLEMVTKLINRYAQEKSKLISVGKENAAVNLIRDYIFEHYEQNISLKTLANLVNLSPFHLNRVFSEKIGMPPHSFQTQVRIIKSKQLIKQGLSLSDVAQASGFADQSHFIRHFKKLMKVTPGEY